MSKTLKKGLALAIILILAALFIFFQQDFISGNKNEEPKLQAARTASRASNAIPVNYIIAEEKLFSNQISVTGKVLANESVELRVERGGKVDKIFFKEGDFVKKGQLLLSTNVDDLKAQVSKAKYNLKLKEQTEYRQDELLKREAISQEEYDLALTELNTALADIQLLEAEIAKSEVRAPFSGYIGLRYVSEGSYIAPTTPIANLYSLNPAKIEFALPAKYIGTLNSGQTVSFNIDAVDKEFQGKVYAIEPGVDPATGAITVRAIAGNDNKILRPGQFTKVMIDLEARENAILVPNQAVIPELEGHKVYVVKDGKASVRKVNIGIRTPTEIEIMSGLNEGDSVITTGLLQINEGTNLELKK
ncbi:efflux RND transporter periplasmic adaptor subunit [Marinigracilibium pacificum]|uniref:Efflux RND transporter periplasmic adaptor subunit n=1 Tax=Marinigracilibium pacificum TaxID=2729599 RepID=A0A848J451_9BACT|nr:efflux RND transporter periplasmic adaptor subunit [Marinigracilibium pacificum]NMM50285.1 efflux RND transporter periplasmic adaptor subunit [Marinigracilibium pacificum]